MDPSAPPSNRDDDDVMPDLRGLSAREALRAPTKIGMTARMSGDGFVSAVPARQRTRHGGRLHHQAG
jgi:hypothetical protein